MRDKAKLPKWAQDEINRLERDVASLKRDLHAIANSGEADAYVDTGDSKIGLPPYSRVIFRVMPGPSCVECVRQGNGIAVYASGGRLLVIPQASNVIHAQVEER